MPKITYPCGFVVRWGKLNDADAQALYKAYDASPSRYLTTRPPAPEPPRKTPPPQAKLPSRP